MTSSKSGVAPPLPESDAFYPPLREYWVAPEEAHQFPFRYGDLFHAPAVDCRGSALCNDDGNPWFAALALSPSCELVSKSNGDDLVEIAQVLPLLETVPHTKPQQEIIRGWQYRDGKFIPAYRHTVFLAPVESETSFNVPMYASLKNTARVPLSALRSADRVAALTHDARVFILRREIQYRYRWVLDTAVVRASEAARISGDQHFKGPRPSWGPFVPPTL